MEVGMDRLRLTDEHRRRINAFAPIYRSVMNQDVDAQSCLDILMERGFRATLADVLDSADSATLVESIQQLAVRDPEFVGRYMADMLGLGDDVNRQKPDTPRIGF
jgi:hypothetical protein